MGPILVMRGFYRMDYPVIYIDIIEDFGVMLHLCCTDYSWLMSLLLRNIKKVASKSMPASIP